MKSLINSKSKQKTTLNDFQNVNKSKAMIDSMFENT